MTEHIRALTPLVCLLAAACNGKGSAAVDNKKTTGPTDCIEVVGGADCTSGGTASGGTGTGSGGTATGTGTGGNGTGSTGGIDTWVGSNNPGSGAGDLYRIEARVDADRDSETTPFWYQTDMRVEIWDDQGQRFQGLDVHLDSQSAGDTVLQEDPQNPGRYEAQVDTYARTYTLRINPTDPTTSFTAEAVGPATHVFQAWPPEPWDVSGADIPIQWAPFGATYASIETRGTGTIDIDDDGDYTLPVDQLDQEAGEIGEERVRLRRWEVLDLTNALGGSWFHVGVRIERDPVDTVDTRYGQLSGDVTLDPNYAGETGDVFVMAWPDVLDPQDDPAAKWARLPDANFVDFGPYLLDMLEPGDWYVLVYLDADHSDAGLPAPAGPTDGDPFDDADVQIDPNGTHVRDFNLSQRWNGW